jgi:hypothetical protein
MRRISKVRKPYKGRLILPVRLAGRVDEAEAKADRYSETPVGGRESVRQSVREEIGRNPGQGLR